LNSSLTELAGELWRYKPGQKCSNGGREGANHNPPNNTVAGIPLPRLDPKVLSRLAECDGVIRGPPFLALPRAPPTLSPPLRETFETETPKSGFRDESRNRDQVSRIHYWKHSLSHRDYIIKLFLFIARYVQ